MSQKRVIKGLHGRHSSRVALSTSRGGGTEGQARDFRKVTRTQGDPGRAIVRKNNVRSHFDSDESKREDVRGFVEFATEDLRANVLSVTLGIDALSSRPLGGQAEITNFEDTLKGNENVSGLQIEVNEPSLVNALQTLHTS